MSKKVQVYPLDTLCYIKGKVVQENNNVYSCTLNQTDIVSNKNKFYIMQVIENGNTYHLYTRYGRIGEDGKIIDKTFTSKNQAECAFEKQFKTKTGNTWGDKDFIKKTGKYFMTEVQYEVDADEIKDDEHEKTNISKLDDRTKFLMELFTNKETMEKTLVSLSINPKKMPLGKISKTQLDNAQKILIKIRNELKINTKENSDDDSDNDSDDELNDNNQITIMSSEFYTYIPYSCGRQKPPVINSNELIGKFTELIDELKNLEVAVKISKQGITDLDSAYNSLNSDIKPLSKDSNEWKIIENYIKNTHGSTHNYKVELVDVFELNRNGEKPEVKKTIEQIGNRHLLWHGSRMTNFCSIIKNGLLLNPESLGVYISGKMFGYGIYTASAFSKSFNYCDSNTSNDYAALLLCDVALGTPSKRTNADYYITKEKLAKDKCNSTWGLGKNTPSSTTKIDDIIVPYGKLENVNNGSVLLYDEFIVYDTNQISLKYLVIVKKI